MHWYSWVITYQHNQFFIDWSHLNFGIKLTVHSKRQIHQVKKISIQFQLLKNKIVFWNLEDRRYMFFHHYTVKLDHWFKIGRKTVKLNKYESKNQNPKIYKKCELFRFASCKSIYTSVFSLLHDLWPDLNLGIKSKVMLRGIFPKY